MCECVNTCTQTSGVGHYLSRSHLSLFALFVHRMEKTCFLTAFALWQEGVITHLLPVLCSAQKHFMMMWSNPPSLETLKNQPSADRHTKSSFSTVCMPYAVIRPRRSLQFTLPAPLGFTMTQRKKCSALFQKHYLVCKCHLQEKKCNQAIRYKGMIIV